MPATRLRTLAQTRAWAANATVQWEIPRDAWLRSMLITFDGTTTVTDTSVPVGRDPMALISEVRLVSNGNDTLVNVTGAELFYLNSYEYGCELDRQRHPVAAANDQPINFALSIDFALFPKFRNDFTCLHPALLDSSLVLYVRFDTEANGLGTNVEDTAGTVRVTLEEVILDVDEVSRYYGGKLDNLMGVRLSLIQKTIDATYANYNFQVDLPTGNILNKILHQVWDDSACGIFYISSEAVRFGIEPNI